MSIDFNINIHFDPEFMGLIREHNSRLDTIVKNQETIMATLDEVLADVTDESTQIAGISTLIAGLKQQLADALAGTTLPPATQAKVDAIFAAAEKNKADIAAALAANTPAAPPAAPPA
jgi:hypothetical protein